MVVRLVVHVAERMVIKITPETPFPMENSTFGNHKKNTISSFIFTRAAAIIVCLLVAVSEVPESRVLITQKECNPVLLYERSTNEKDTNNRTK